MNETGSVKFKCEQLPAEIPRFTGFDQLNEYRRKLVDLGLIGIDANGISFGNISVRGEKPSEFYVTGSGTGDLATLSPTDCAKVVAYDVAKNWLKCEGGRVASSESLTHGAVYESNPTANAVIHCHNLKLWSALLDKAPTTPKRAAYGTPEMAQAVRQLFDTTNVKTKKIFVMAGHEGGLVAFGNDLAEAFKVLINQNLEN